jgi:hypothetical protein
VKGYYEILVDTLLSRFLPAYTRRPQRTGSSRHRFKHSFSLSG